MKKTLIFLLLILLPAISGAAGAAYDLDMYPIPFVEGGNFTAQIIVGGASPSSDVVAAIEISNSLQKQSNTRFTGGLDDEFDIWKNGILIGLPCHNTAIAKVLGTKECDIGFANGTGYLKLVERSGQTFLIVTGKTPADTRKAARLLAQSNVHSLSGTEVKVTGTLDNPKAEKTDQPLEIETPQPGCKSDSDCKGSEYCSSGTCKDLGCPEGTAAQNHNCIAEEITATGKAQEAQKTAENPEPRSIPAPIENKLAEQPSPETPEKKPGFFTRILSFFRNLFR